MSKDSRDETDAARTEGDLRETGMSLRHDREWDYELDRIVDAVAERGAETVGLQFPEGLKRRGPRVADDLRAELPDDVTVMISGQPCYGACDLDTYLMRRTDVFVHFGHSPMKESDKIIYVPLFSNVDVVPIVEEALETELATPDEDADIGLVTTAQHMNTFDEMRSLLETRGYTVHTRKGDDRLTNFGLDAYVNTGCPRITTDDGPQFKQPMLTPQEYRIAVGEEPLDALEFDTFHDTW
jgi:2-(3-amino-3-carboxypropyl)histidine synthase